jgi:nucleoside-diphosphate-sugar epimerase
LLGVPAPEPARDAPPVHLSDAPHESCPDLSKARSILGYEPRIGLREGLERTIAWHRHRAGVGA